MRKWQFIPALFVGLLVALSIATPVRVKAQLTMTGIGGAFGGTVFVGAGNISGFSSPQAYWSCAFALSSSTTVGTNACHVRDSGGSNTFTITTQANGQTNYAAAASSAACATACFLDEIYDQSGNAWHLTQATFANMPPLHFSAINTFPAAFGDGSTNYWMSFASCTTINQAMTFAGATASPASGTHGTLISDANVVEFGYWPNSPVNYFETGGTIFNPISPGGSSPKGVVMVLNSPGGASTSVVNMDGSESGSPGNAGSGNLCSGVSTLYAFNSGSGGGTMLNGLAGEMGLWTFGANSTQRNNLVANIQSRWGGI